ncbi:MAG TPA: HAD-IA family hydrolase [Candidatus Dormibacteraeota bacterium]|nr:HAD-IA family hydrolase [Candidatus Dormibacteraeota bacterium]
MAALRAVPLQALAVDVDTLRGTPPGAVAQRPRHHGDRGASFLEAVVFDVDGTLVDSERDGHRVAFNRAFEELGLPDRWDVDHYGRLLAITGGRGRIDAHLASRGMPADERAAVVPRLHERKTEIFCAMAAAGSFAPRPGAEELLRDLENARIRLAVATTGTRAWVTDLLDRVFGTDRFEVVVTGDEAPNRKPDPSAYLQALQSLGVTPAFAIAVEDSENGLSAAGAAGLPCVVVVNGYTAGQRFDGADLVLDGFGDGDRPAEVLLDPHGVGVRGVLDATVLSRVATEARTGATR